MKTLKPLLFFLLLLFVFSCKEKQKSAPNQAKPNPIIVEPSTTAINTYNNIDISPMDMIYFPVEYPKLKMSNSEIAPPITRVIYSRPHLAKRHLFHDLLKYDEPWRLGANEATEIDFYKPVTIQGKKINPGRYILYCIPHPDAWTIVLNSNIDSWGLQQDPKKDIQRFKIPIITGNPPLEYFTMQYEKTDTGANLQMAWDSVSTKLPIVF